MNTFFGLQGAAVTASDPAEIAGLGQPIVRYGFENAAVLIRGSIAMAVQPRARTRPSKEECLQPIEDHHGRMLAFDGRLDNRQELMAQLGIREENFSDPRLALETFNRWGEESFGRLIGDWALALCSADDQSLYLSRDHAGTRTLYYHVDEAGARWSTEVGIVLRACFRLTPSSDYLSQYLRSAPQSGTTPYTGVSAVKAGHYVRIRSGSVVERAHWEPSLGQAIRYRSDAEYEEHFRWLLAQSIGRRSRPGESIIAELSGGMDSSSIVCMSDHLRSSSGYPADLLDTVSYYDAGEASLNDAEYYQFLEARRGKAGIHINTAFAERTFAPFALQDPEYPYPGADASFLEREQRFEDALWSKGYRCVLSGAGGDELLGGVPNPLPELSTYLVSGHLRTLLSQSFRWSLVDRAPLIQTLWQTFRYTGELYLTTGRYEARTPPWLSRAETHRTGRQREIGSARQWKLPVGLDNAQGWTSVVENLPHLFPLALARPEYRYPFLDRNLVEFLFNIPRAQLLRPGQRRSLMRRSLVGIVPQKILERRRKAFQLTSPLRTVAATAGRLRTIFCDSILEQQGLIEAAPLLFWLERTAQGDPTWWQAVARTATLEIWLRAFYERHAPLQADSIRIHPLSFDREPPVSELRTLSQCP